MFLYFIPSSSNGFLSAIIIPISNSLNTLMKNILPIFEHLYNRSVLPVTESLCSKIIALPVHHGLGDNEITYIQNVFENIAGDIEK